MKFSDFDVEHKTVAISRQIVANPIIREGGSKIEENTLIECDPKTPNSFRVLRVPEVIITELENRKSFETKKAANADRDKTIGELYSGTYVVYANVKVKDFMLFWLEKEMQPRITSDSYVSYANIVKNHIIPAIGTMKMTELNRGHVQTLYNEEAAVSVWSARQVKTVMNTSLLFCWD